MGEVIMLGCVTSLDIPVARVLDMAKDHLEGCVVMGWDHHGELYFASTYADGGTVMWLIEMCKKRLLEIGDGDGENK
jgi:hypothetical protein